jgi:transposase
LIRLMEATTAVEKEARRRLAVQRVGEGWSQQAVAGFLGVHPVTVGKWVRAHRAAGDDGLTATPHPGRTPFLTENQQQRVLGWLARKPSEFGFATDLWTARRVAELIRQKFGVEYHPNYLREWLTKRGYSPQKPIKRAKERNPEAIARWVREDWRRIQKKRPTGARTSC